jgi:hypothetical protein
MAETPKYSPDGKPLNEAARKALNTAIKRSSQGTQDRLRTLSSVPRLGIKGSIDEAKVKSGKTRIGKLAGGLRGGIGGGGMNWQTK